MPARKIAILGCGYVGTALARHLVAAGHDVAGTTTTPARREEIAAAAARPVVLRADDVAAVADLVAKCDTVYLTVAAGRDGDYSATYLAAARSLVTALPTSAASRVIYTSSTSVYGQNDGSVVDENSPTEPDEPNARVLLQAERALLDGVAVAAVDRPRTATVLRLGGIYGPGRELERYVLPAAGTTRGDGDVFVNLVHRDDIVAVLAALLENPYHGVLNLTDNHPVRRRELYDAILAARGAAPITWTTIDHPALGKRVRSDAIQRLLDWSPGHLASQAARKGT